MHILMVVYDNDSSISYFPLGLGYLASALRNEGHVITIYQQDIYHYPDSHLTCYLNEKPFDAVIVSVIGGYYQYHKLLKLSKAINASINRGNFHFLIGGHGPAAVPEFYLRKTKADIVGIGEGEITIIELMRALQGFCKLDSVSGIAYIDECDQFHKTKPRELIADIDSIAYPAYDLFEMEHYVLHSQPNMSRTSRSISMLSGRGCTFACNFCYRMDKGFRPRSAAALVTEIQLLKAKYHINYVSFEDELLMSSTSRTMELCQAFIDAKLDIWWSCNGRLNYADLPVLQKMKEAGCVFINYGIESLDHATLKIMHKALTREIITNGVENTLKVGISPGLNFIFGNINEPISAIDDAVDFLLKYDDHAQLRTLRPVTPYPGTELYEYAIEKGLLKDAEDFYEHKHINSDLVAVNFTKYTDEQVSDALCKANKRLIERYIEVQKKSYMAVCDDLYYNRNANFRGFRAV